MKTLILFLLTLAQAICNLYPQEFPRSFFSSNVPVFPEGAPPETIPLPDLALTDWQGNVRELIPPHTFEVTLTVTVENQGNENFQSFEEPDALIQLFRGQKLIAQKPLLCLEAGMHNNIRFSFLYQALIHHVPTPSSCFEVRIVMSSHHHKDKFFCNDDAEWSNNQLKIFEWQLHEMHNALHKPSPDFSLDSQHK